MNLVYVTGNQHKARYFSEILGLDIEHAPADVDEVQSLDLVEVVTKKAMAAYEKIGRPVLVEDTKLTIDVLGNLPGPLIKWFLEELGNEGLCRLADKDPDRRAFAAAAFAYYDGKTVKTFEGGLAGSIADKPRGDSMFGWNPIFIPAGSDQTLGEMKDEDFKKAYTQIKPFQELRDFLNQTH